MIEQIEDFNLDTRFGDFRLRAYPQTTNNQVHIALTTGEWKEDDKVLIKVNSTLINNALGLLTNNPDEKFQRIFNLINKEKAGAVVFINQENQSQNLINQLMALKDEKSFSRVDIYEKDFGIGAQILHDLGICKIRLISNNVQTKRVGIIGYGLEITEYIPF